VFSLIISFFFFNFKSLYCPYFVRICFAAREIIIVVSLCFFFQYLINSWLTLYIFGLHRDNHWLWFIDFQFWKNHKKVIREVKGIVRTTKWKYLNCVKHKSCDDIFFFLVINFCRFKDVWKSRVHNTKSG
jgi:hypothetical protein